MKKFFLTIIASFPFLFSAWAQTEKIDTDRPDQTESPYTVPKKWMQFEMGFGREKDKPDPDFKTIFSQYPTLLTKYGLGKRLELRLITEFAGLKEVAQNGISKHAGLHSVQLGGKVNLFDEKGARPKTSLIAHYDFARFRTWYRDSVDGLNFRFTMQKSFSKTIGLGCNLGMEWERFGSPPAFIYTLAPGFNISDKWYAYIEVFGAAWKDDSPEHSIDGGIAYYINDNLKIDLSGGFGINKKAPDNYFAIGGSFRFKAGK